LGCSNHCKERQHRNTPGVKQPSILLVGFALVNDIDLVLTFHARVFITFAAAATVRSMSSAVCAAEMNPASNCDGAR